MSASRIASFALFCGACTSSEPAGLDAGTGDAPFDAQVFDAGGSDAPADSAQVLGPARLYVGGGDGKIRIFSFDATTYVLAPIDVTSAGGNPSFLAFTPDRKFLYAVDEAMSKVQPFAIDSQTGKLTPLATASSMGMGPAHVSTDFSGTLVMVANYGNGTIAIFPRAADGTLMAASATRSYGNGAQTHQIVTDPSHAFVLVPNKGLSAVSVHRLNGMTLTDVSSTPAGNGARHVAFDPSGAHAYVIDETGSTISAFTFDSQTGALSPIQTISSLADGGVPNNTGAEIQVTLDGKHVLASNRGDDSIVVFDLDASGKLKLSARVPTGGSTPRHFQIEETGHFLFVGNQTSGTVITMKMDPTTGIPSIVGTPLMVPNPEFTGLIHLPL
jgi:6-phosphogluconolactonase (cycloisomerase 2 family)